jgi:hypothetical protein
MLINTVNIIWIIFLLKEGNLFSLKNPISNFVISQICDECNNIVRTNEEIFSTAIVSCIRL